MMKGSVVLARVHVVSPHLPSLPVQYGTTDINLYHSVEILHKKQRASHHHDVSP